MCLLRKLSFKSYPSEHSMAKVGKQVEETVRGKTADFATEAA